jgi:hypothetical protein
MPQTRVVSKPEPSDLHLAAISRTLSAAKKGGKDKKGGKKKNGKKKVKSCKPGMTIRAPKRPGKAK